LAADIAAKVELSVKRALRTGCEIPVCARLVDFKRTVPIAAAESTKSRRFMMHLTCRIGVP
jgi:hypothetical protein